jgi:hypothetical protein
MLLAEYLASEQAREDVKALLDGDKPSLPVMSMEDLCLVRDEVGAWRSVMIWDDNQNKELTAYYRPDGDRYVVTDLGDGVRALRLRTGVLHSRAAAEAAKARQGICRDQEWTMGGTADLELEGFKPEQLPDAICRVMLASLRVAQS